MSKKPKRKCEIGQQINSVRFVVTTSPHGMLCISKECSTSEMMFLKRALRANHLDDQFYQQRRKAHAFFQAGSDSKSGYALIEFWTDDKKAVTDYVNWLNSVYDEEVRRLTVMFS